MKRSSNSVDKFITRITSLIAALIVIVVLTWGGWSFWKNRRCEETNDAQVQEYINPLISRAGGFITRVNFEENQYLHKGDTLLVIDNREYSFTKQQTEASLANARAQLAVLQSNVLTLQKAADALQPAIAATQAKLLRQQQEEDRYRQLLAVESATRQQVEAVEANRAVAEADCQAARGSYTAAQGKVRDACTQQQVVRAEIERLLALLQRNTLDVSYTVILAPYNCRIGRRTVEVGQMIDPGQVLAYVVDKESDKWVVANFKETQLANLQVGQHADIVADAYPGKHFSGHIISLSPATGSAFSLLPPDNATGNYVKIVQRVPVRIRIDDTDSSQLEAGMNVNVLIPKKS